MAVLLKCTRWAFGRSPKRSLRLRFVPHMQCTAGGDHPIGVAVSMRITYRAPPVAVFIATPLHLVAHIEVDLAASTIGVLIFPRPRQLFF